MAIQIISATVNHRDPDYSAIITKTSIDNGPVESLGVILREGRDDPEGWRPTGNGTNAPLPNDLAIALHEALDAQYPDMVESELERICS